MVPTLCRADTGPLLNEFPGVNGMHLALVAGAAGLFVVAAKARLTRRDAGKALLHAMECKSLVLHQHAA